MAGASAGLGSGAVVVAASVFVGAVAAGVVAGVVAVVVVGVVVVAGGTSAAFGRRSVNQAARNTTAPTRRMRMGGEIWLTANQSASPRRKLRAMGSRPEAEPSAARPPRRAAPCRPPPARRSADRSPRPSSGRRSRRGSSRGRAMIATIRSMPSASPPCGGAPYFSASSRNPKRASASSSEMPSAVKTCCWTSGRLIRIDPPPISEPFEHDVVRARAQRARVLEGAQRRRERMMQRVPALLARVPLEHREVDDPQQLVAAARGSGRSGARSPAAARPARSPRPTGSRRRRSAAGRRPWPAGRLRSCARSSSESALAAGERHVPSSLTTAHTRPPAP